MQFKEVINLKTNKRFYYVDNKKVNSETYTYKMLLCRQKGYNYNSSITYEKDNKIYNLYSMD